MYTSSSSFGGGRRGKRRGIRRKEEGE